MWTREWVVCVMCEIIMLNRKCVVRCSSVSLVRMIVLAMMWTCEGVCVWLCDLFGCYSQHAFIFVNE